MMDKKQFEKFKDIPAEKFSLAADKDIHDQKLDTKPVGYFKDAWSRFKKNRASVVAFGIIVALLLFAIIVPFFTSFTVQYKDDVFKNILPKTKIAEKTGIDFWDGCVEKKSVNKETYLIDKAIGIETGQYVIKNDKVKITQDRGIDKYNYRRNSYAVGVKYKDFDLEEYARIQQYQEESGRQVFLPMTISNLRPTAVQNKDNANYWFATAQIGNQTQAVLDSNGDFKNIYVLYDGTDGYSCNIRIEGSIPKYNYSEHNQSGVRTRIDYYEYYIYYHTIVLKDGIKEPLFLFGTTAAGKDVLSNLASGARFSFILAFTVALVNMFVGTIIGATEGYFGGIIDLIGERISDILAAVPFMVVITLLNYHMKESSQILVLFIAFFLTGWIGMASRVRMQFYRFKNQEYVLAARTLGAKNGRIMFKHIFPNTLGTIVTGSILIIPSMIFAESTLTYLNIINLESGNITSVGTMLASAQNSLKDFPHMMLFPALFISLLMLSFNLFGNGLRDAFNPALRGSGE